MTFSADELNLFLRIARDATLGNSLGERLDATTDALSELIPDASVSVILVDSTFATPPREGHVYVKGIPMSDVADYATNFMTHDPMHVVYREATGEPAALSDFVPKRRFGRDVFTSDWCGRTHVRHIVGSVHPMPDGLLMGLALHRPPEAGDFRPHEREALKIASPEIARACFGMLLRERLEPPPPPTNAPTSGVFLLTPVGDILHADEGARWLAERVAPEDGPLLDLLVREARRLASIPRREGSRTDHALRLVDGRWLRLRIAPVQKGPLQVLAILEVLVGGSREHFEAIAARAGWTPREREIAARAARGLTNRQIALDLGISPVTVNIHLNHVYAKSGCASRAELVALVAGGNER